jgi:hypothetical protein
MSIIIREARGLDFERVYPLLLQFESSNPKEHWRQLFIDHTGLQNDRFGWVLVDGDDVVGFLSTILSERTIHGKTERLCNISSWIVRPEYRAHSLALLAKVTGDKSVTVTNLSPTARALKIMEKFGFTLMDKSQRIIFPVITAKTFIDSCEILTSASSIHRALSGERLRFYRDHQLPFNHHVLLRTPTADCYIIMNRTLKTVRANLRLPFAGVHYISNPDIFVRHSEKLVARVAASLKVVAIVVDDRMLKGTAPWNSFMRPKKQAAFRSKKLMRMTLTAFTQRPYF